MSDSDSEEFTGFTQADLGDENNDFIPDSEPDWDFSISTVHSKDISNLGEDVCKMANDTNGILCKSWGERWPFMVVICVVCIFVGKVATMHTISKIKPKRNFNVFLEIPLASLQKISLPPQSDW